MHIDRSYQWVDVVTKKNQWVDAASIHVSLLAYLSEVPAVGFGKNNVAVVISGYAQASVSPADYLQRRQPDKEVQYNRKG